MDTSYLGIAQTHRAVSIVSWDPSGAVRETDSSAFAASVRPCEFCKKAPSSFSAPLSLTHSRSTESRSGEGRTTRTNGRTDGWQTGGEEERIHPQFLGRRSVGMASFGEMSSIERAGGIKHSAYSSPPG